MPKPLIGRKIREEMGLISSNPLDKLGDESVELIGLQKDKNGKYSLIQITVNNKKITKVEIDEPKGRAFAFSRFKTEAGRNVLK